MPTGIQVSGSILVGTQKPTDARYGPYASTSAALSDLTSVYRYKGLTVGIETGGVITEYWFNDGIQDTDFVVKSVDDFLGATETLDGASGLVPRPLVTNRGQYLKGDGSWSDIPTPNLPTGSQLTYVEVFNNNPELGLRILLEGATGFNSVGLGPWAPVVDTTLGIYQVGDFSPDVSFTATNGRIAFSPKASVNLYQFVATIGCFRGNTGSNGVDIGISIDGQDPIPSHYTSIPTAGFSTTQREISVSGVFALSAGVSHHVRLMVRQNGGGATGNTISNPTNENSITMRTLNLNINSINALVSASTFDGILSINGETPDPSGAVVLSPADIGAQSAPTISSFNPFTTAFPAVSAHTIPSGIRNHFALYSNSTAANATVNLPASPLEGDTLTVVYTASVGFGTLTVFGGNPDQQVLQLGDSVSFVAESDGGTVFWTLVSSSVQADWSEGASSSPRFIRSKPTIPALTNTAPANLADTAAVGTSTEAARADHVHRLPTSVEVQAEQRLTKHTFSIIFPGTPAAIQLNSTHLNKRIRFDCTTPQQIYDVILPPVGDSNPGDRIIFENLVSDGSIGGVPVQHQLFVRRTATGTILAGLEEGTYHEFMLLGNSLTSGLVSWEIVQQQFVPPSPTEAGRSGLVPVPKAGDGTKFLKGDGTWTLPSPADIGAASSSDLDQLFALNLALS